MVQTPVTWTGQYTNELLVLMFTVHPMKVPDGFRRGRGGEGFHIVVQAPPDVPCDAMQPAAQEKQRLQS